MEYRDITFLLPWIFTTGLIALFVHAPKLQLAAGSKPGLLFNIFEILTLFLGLSLISLALFPHQESVSVLFIEIWMLLWIPASVIAIFLVKKDWAVFPAAYPVVFLIVGIVESLGHNILVNSGEDYFKCFILTVGAATSWLSIAALTISRRKSRPRLISTPKLKLKAGQN